MTDHAPADLAHKTKDVIDQRTRAFVALALGLVGTLNGGIIGSALVWALVRVLDNTDERIYSVVQGLVPMALGAAALVLGNAASRTLEPVATPAGRTAMVLGAVAVVGGVLTVLVGLFEG